MTSTLIGIDLGGTKCAVSIADGERGVREVARFPTARPQETIERIFAEIEKLDPDASPRIGISCGGPLDAGAGLILSPPNMRDWDRIPICELVTKKFGGSAHLMNDANACALAEWHEGAGQGVRNLIFLTMGTGMGAGLILDGRLYEGSTGDAGEVGHLRLSGRGPIGFGKAGSFEGWCSGGGIAQLARERTATFTGESSLRKQAQVGLTAQDIGAAARAGDALALAIWEEVGTRLGEGIALLVDILNPERIVIGSIFARCGEFIIPAMQSALEREALEPSVRACRIVPAALGETIGSHAAIAIARYHGSAD